MERIEEKWKEIQKLISEMDPAEAEKRVNDGIWWFCFKMVTEAWLDDLFVDDYDKMQSRIDIINKLMFDKEKGEK